MIPIRLSCHKCWQEYWESAFEKAKLLAKKEGVLVGISSGANFIGCIMAQEKLGAESIIATVFADDNKKYLSTDYSEEQEMKEQYISHDVQLMGVIAHR